ncbi:MAG: leucine-rich repeat domain-containing protein [Bacteroidaceae bacterium]|nr:leucine-rich repeat domain-containing protein [Bacteroidaceae bacterium]
MASSEISVNLKEPGSLGTEVLYHTDHIKNVRRLKVKGTMNDDDWGKLKMMSRLQHVDLSEAVFTEIPEGQFRYTGNDTTMRFLKSLVLPEGVKTIHKNAFEYSRIESLNIPSTVELVNQYAFHESYVKELSFPANTKFEGDYIFSTMPLLEKLVLPKNLESIPRYAFERTKGLTDVVWPDSLKTISDYAFMECSSLQNFSNSTQTTSDTMIFPFVQTIGYHAFSGCGSLKNVELHAVKYLDHSAFNNCANLTNVTVNADLYHFEGSVFSNCPKLSTLKLYSPTVVTYPNNNNPAGDLKNVTLQVPHYLVNSYKLDEYWYNAKIEGFDYSDMTYIPIRQNLTLNSERFGGKPAVEVFESAYLKINGNDAQAFQNMKFNVNPGESLYGQLLNNSNTVTQEGELKLSYYTKAKKWYFISLPFDLDIAKITQDAANAQYAIRSYDGATRAVNGATGNWKNIDRTTTIPAGTGFIFQTNVDTWSTFFAAEGSENLAISTDEFEKTLEVNASTENSHKGWNLVGNPYQCFYNNHMLNFTAPITVWDVDKKTYAAYSITDDDYALRPNEAFFIQCPNAANNTISFPLQGRQLTNVINSQNAVKANGAAVRKLVDITLAQGEMEDKTRVVFNDNASLAYETSCDAGKFMSMEADVPQIYTLDAESNTYAINERPFADGIVQLGIYVAKEGTCTFSAPRNSIGNVYLVDNKEGTIVNLREQDYTFQSEAGTIEGRFSLCLNASGTANGIGETLENAVDNGQIYDLGGRSVSKTQKKGVYVVRKAGKSEKVMVK